MENDYRSLFLFVMC